jgi:hypothetical protein
MCVVPTGRPATTPDTLLSGSHRLTSTHARIAVLVAAVVAAGLIALTLVSHFAPGINTGPLGDGGEGGGICIPIARGQVESWGITYLGNTGSSDAVIQKIDLVQPRNLRLVASYVVPITGNFEYGSYYGYPPAHTELGVQWPQHKRAIGASIPPQHGHAHGDLLTVLKPTAGPVAEAQAIDVYYQESGTSYHMQTHYRFVLLVGQKTCPDNWPQKYPA